MDLRGWSYDKKKWLKVSNISYDKHGFCMVQLFFRIICRSILNTCYKTIIIKINSLCTQIPRLIHPKRTEILLIPILDELKLES